MRKATMIGKILAKIDWTQIQDYHKKLNILWDIENKDGTTETRTPETYEIKSELESLLLYVIDNDLDYISYGNWVIFWDENDDEVRVIFRLNDWFFTLGKKSSHTPFVESKRSKEDLQKDLARAVDEEDYLKAAEIRDELQKIDKKD